MFGWQAQNIAVEIQGFYFYYYFFLNQTEGAYNWVGLHSGILW